MALSTIIQLYRGG